MSRPYRNIPLRSLQQRNGLLDLLVGDLDVLLKSFLLRLGQLSQVIARVGHDQGCSRDAMGLDEGFQF